MIPAEIVTRTWQHIAHIPISEAPLLMEQMKTEQPVILAYLLAADGLSFNRNECEIILYLGMVARQIAKQSQRKLRKVTRKKLRRAKEANDSFLERLDASTEAGFEDLTPRLMHQYPEPDVLRYIVEAFVEGDPDPDEIPIRNEYKSLALVYLRTALDAFTASLAPQPR
jgi:hypothetical protein